MRVNNKPGRSSVRPYRLTRSASALASAEAAGDLLKLLTAHAEAGLVCPSISVMALTVRRGEPTVKQALTDLRKRGHIDWKLIYRNRQCIGRVVKIIGTGKSTGKPKPPTEAAGPTFAPGEFGCRVRDLRRERPEEFAYWKALYETREADLRRREAAWA